MRIIYSGEKRGESWFNPQYLGTDILPNIDLDTVLVKCMQDSTEFFYVSCDEMKGYDIFVRIK